MSTKHSNGPTWEAVLAFGGPKTRYVGVDEVGRGAWAGPVVAAAVILPFGTVIPGLDDSKRLTERRRLELDGAIRAVAAAVGLGWVEPNEVDDHGLSWAVRTSGLRAIEGLDIDYDMVLLDGLHNYLDATMNARALVRGDALLPPISAASIVAKVARDTFMASLAHQLPDYGFEKHKGYGTAHHLAALKRLGAIKHHRLSVHPVRELG